MQERDRVFRLNAEALALGKASECLALDPRAMGRTMALSAFEPAPPAPAQNIAVVSILGPLAQRADRLCGFVDGYDAITARVCKALDDRSVDAVVLVIDSPGGDAAGVFEAVRRMRAAVADSGKPVLAYADEMAASAAFAIATVANEGIYLPASGQVGSVGVISVHFDESGAFEAEGVQPTIIRSGTQKCEGNPLEPLSPEALGRMQARVDELAQQFADLVAPVVGMTAAAVLALEGAVFTGDAAVRAGLATEVATLEQVIERAGALAKERAMAGEKGAAAAAVDARASAELEVGRLAMALVGETEPARAIAKVREGQAALAAVEARRAEDARAAAVAESKERKELMLSMVRAKKITSANAWVTGESGPDPELGVAEPWASMTLAHLRAAAGKIEAPAGAYRPAESSASTAATSDDEAKARKNGVTAKSWAEARAEIAQNNRRPVAAVGS